jgi:tetratricopeptide (TPR) repeat protein
MRRTQLFLLVSLLSAHSAMAIDLNPLWDFSKPALSEERFRNALVTASGDDALILKTQIARTYGLRRDFERARQVLAEVAPQLGQAGAEAQARYWLELGRTYSSATHDDASQTEEAKTNARSAYNQAIEIARKGRVDALVIDALHMMAFIDRAPEDGVRWADEGLKIALASKQPAAQGWEPVLRNNRGYALHQLGRNEEALAEFRRALPLYEQRGKTDEIRIAHWMIAMTLRHLGRLYAALEIQQRLEREWDADGEPDPYVFEELEQIYRARGDQQRADHYAARLVALKKKP